MIGALLLSALAMGLLGSTHCVVMCGGVVSLLSGRLVQIGATGGAARAKAARASLAYNAGRIASYAGAGALAGAFGALVEHVPGLHGVTLALRLSAGILMLAVGLYLAGALHGFAAIERLGAPIWRFVEPAAKRLMAVPSLAANLALGALWGWMPCGLVYAALGVALATGSATSGAFVMIAFGAGTLPILFTMGALAARVGRAARLGWVRRVAGAVIVAFGLLHVVSASAQIAAHGTVAHACCADHHGGR